MRKVLSFLQQVILTKQSLQTVYVTILNPPSKRKLKTLNILIHYLKNIYLYSVEHGLLSLTLEDLELKELPFNWRFIPLKYPQPEVLLKGEKH